MKIQFEIEDEVVPELLRSFKYKGPEKEKDQRAFLKCLAVQIFQNQVLHARRRRMQAELKKASTIPIR